MLNIYKDKEKQTTTAVVTKSEHDARSRIVRRLGLSSLDIYFIGDYLCLDKTKMNKTYSGTVHCDERDTYDEAVGVDKAVKKAMDNHNRAFMRAIIRWQVAMLKKIKSVSPETFDEAVTKMTGLDKK